MHSAEHEDRGVKLHLLSINHLLKYCFHDRIRLNCREIIRLVEFSNQFLCTGY
jgi:hypothetical protein